MFAFLLVVLNWINLTNFASHAEISDFTNTHFVDQHVLQLDVSVNIAHGVMEVLETPHDLPEHHANVIVWESRSTAPLKNIVQGAGRTILSNEVIGVGSMFGFEQRENMFVMK